MADTGQVDAESRADSRREYGVDLIGPTRPDSRWQSRAGEGCAARDITIDGDRQQATCPEGQTSLSWTPALDRSHNDVTRIKFSAKDCGPCPARTRCTKVKRRIVTIRPRDQRPVRGSGSSPITGEVGGVPERVQPEGGDRGDDLIEGYGLAAFAERATSGR